MGHEANPFRVRAGQDQPWKRQRAISTESRGGGTWDSRSDCEKPPANREEALSRQGNYSRSRTVKPPETDGVRQSTRLPVVRREARVLLTRAVMFRSKGSNVCEGDSSSTESCNSLTKSKSPWLLPPEPSVQGSVSESAASTSESSSRPRDLVILPSPLRGCPPGEWPCLNHGNNQDRSFCSGCSSHAVLGCSFRGA